MRRYSQRHNLGTLAELNVTPLLDLAFVLLIIFMITTPLMEKNESLVLPTSNAALGAIGPEDQVDISITREDGIILNKQSVSLDQLESQLVALKESHPRIAVNIRADKELTVQKFTEASDVVRKAGITAVTLAATFRIRAMSDKSLFRRNLLIIVGLHILLIAGFFLSGIFPRHQDNVAWLDGGGSPQSSQQNNDNTEPDSTPDESTPAPTPEKTSEDMGTPAPSMIVLGTPAPQVATPTPRRTPTPATPKPTPTPRITPSPTATPRHSPSPSPKKSPSRSPSPKSSPKKSASPKTSPKHSASPSDSAKPSPTDNGGDDTNAGVAASGTSTSHGKAGTKPGDGGGDRGGHGSAGGGKEQINFYLSMIHDRIYSRWSCPDVSADLSTIVKIRIQKDGHVSDVSLEKSSGNSIMDESAMVASKSITQFDPLPSAIEDSFYDVPIEFKPTAQ